MVDYIVWSMADPLKVLQAACLWAGVDPSSAPSSISMAFLPEADKVAIAPRLQMLTGAIANGELRADTRTNPMSAIGNHADSLVTRADLKAFAESRRERPAFLFDTFLKACTKSQSKRSTVLFDIFPRPSEEALKNDTTPHKKHKGGRPPEWDWDTFFLEIIRIANCPDGLPETRAKLAEIMRNWFVYQCDDHPADTTIEDRIRPIYDYIDRSRKPGSK